jgi:hypothetical protein
MRLAHNSEPLRVFCAFQLRVQGTHHCVEVESFWGRLGRHYILGLWDRASDGQQESSSFDSVVSLHSQNELVITPRERRERVLYYSDRKFSHASRTPLN